MVYDGTGLDDTALLAPRRTREGRTGVSLVSDNLVAFSLRSLSARAANETIDLQYYMWDEDVTGHLLIREILRAADRGVKVRLLLDDLYVRRTERSLAALGLHPSIQIRFFNPFQFRWLGLLGDAIEFLYTRYRLNHRMHNKAWIVDRRLVIGGGRNIGDKYFDASSQFNFRDLDLVVEGNEVAQALALFEVYWSSARVRPLNEIPAIRVPEDGIEGLRRVLDASALTPAASGYLRRLNDLPPLSVLLERHRVFVDRHEISFVADPPGKGQYSRLSPFMLNTVWNALGVARNRILLISPYFVPGRRGARLLTTLARRGVKISVLTNSLAATDVLAVHGGYVRYRRRLLRAGIEIYELRRGVQQSQSLFGSGHASLHTKAFTVDDQMTFVGSFNIDPRSAYLNTEMGILVREDRLSRGVAEEFTRLIDPDRSWKVTLEKRRLVWTAHTDGQSTVSLHEPDASLTRRVIARILGRLPIEHQL